MLTLVRKSKWHLLMMEQNYAHLFINDSDDTKLCDHACRVVPTEDLGTIS